jgi:hypothetical protein
MPGSPSAERGMCDRSITCDHGSVPDAALSSIDEAQQTALDAADAPIAVLDGDGTIIGVNAAWLRFGAENGRPDAGTDRGARYPTGAVVGLDEVLAGRLASCSIVYPCHSPDEERWFRLIGVVVGHDPARVLVIHRRLADAPVDGSLTAAGEEMARRWVGIRTICGWCGIQARDSLGAWHAIDDAPAGQISHGLCPLCLERLVGPTTAFG